MVRDVLDRHHFVPKEDRGQYFLDSQNVVEKMVEEAELEGSETVLEIGAGVGTITKQLAGEVESVLAYENDPELVRILRDEMEGYDNVKVRDEDVLKAEVPEFDVCVSNIPFHLSSDILDFLLERQERGVIIVQEEFAQRLLAEPGEDAYSLTTVLTNFGFIPAYIEEVPSTSFYPQMDVETAIVKFFPREEEFSVGKDYFREVSKALFVHSKKKLRNAFYDSRHMFDVGREEAKELRDEIPYSEERVRKLEFRELIEVTEFLEQALD
ncbi:MAG: 16S rRNA (adenine(1518)-N(6)/adenine(1519)-N(6))-dimethyltransferase RsmA [Candidatus Nanohaloarchaeota archaeon QJJ-7]|nr:16S rRNA (adenine(1518)-N(6)/adenine(1519)-N(6))-dimethyltransferase RsmA [Candidatus Nanohaloarchaeota archaeon QJJ-7]